MQKTRYEQVLDTRIQPRVRREESQCKYYIKKPMFTVRQGACEQLLIG